MSIAPQLIAFLALKNLFKSKSTLSWNELQAWIATNSNRDNIGRGYAGGRLPESGTGGFAELIRENRGESVRINATITFDKRNGPIARNSWDATKLDAKLEKMFGNNLRVRIDV